MNVRRMAAWLVAGAAIGLLAACGGGDDDDTGGATTAPADATPDGGDGGEFFAGVGIEASDFEFMPRDLEVTLRDDQTGVAIDFENASGTLHTFALYYDEDYEQPVEGGSASTPARIELDATGGPVERGETYFFRCEIHPDKMQGVLRIE